MRPSRHFEQHFDVEPPRIDEHAFRPAWRVRTRLDRLMLAGSITRLEYQKAISYRRTHELAYAGLYPARSMTPGGGNGADWFTPSKIDALTELREIEARIGATRIWWLEACVVYDISWRALAAALNVDYRTARNLTICAIQALAEKNSLDTLCR